MKNKTIISLCLILIGSVAIWHGTNNNSATQTVATTAPKSPVQEIASEPVAPIVEPKNAGYVVTGTARSKMVQVGSTARPAVVSEATVRQSIVQK